VLGNRSQGLACRLLDSRVKLLQTGDERVEGSTVDHVARKFLVVLGDGPEYESSGFLVESVLFAETLDQLRQNLVGHDSVGQLFRVGSDASEGEGSRLLDGGHVVQHQRSQELQYSCTLEGVNVFVSLG